MLTSAVIDLVGDPPLPVDFEKYEVTSKGRGSVLQGCLAHGRPSISANRNGCAERRYAVLVEAFDRDPVLLSDIERAQLECRPFVMEALIRLVQLVRRDPPANVIADDVGYR